VSSAVEHAPTPEGPAPKPQDSGEEDAAFEAALADQAKQSPGEPAGEFAESQGGEDVAAGDEATAGEGGATTEMEAGADAEHPEGPARDEDAGVAGKEDAAAPDRVARRADDGAVAPDAGERLAHAAADAGETLPPPIMRKFEAALGTDLDGVRVHTGEAAAGAAVSVGARAFTTGDDIYFAGGA
jgi:hypothetical protein